MAGHDEWETPGELWERLDGEFHFDLDAAATPANAKCSHFITPEEDALLTEWDGEVVWCNPPYTRLREFVERGWRQSVERGNVVVMLIPTYTDPRYWVDIVVPHAAEIRMLVGRVSFLEEGRKRMSARFPSTVVRFGGREHEGRDGRIWWWRWKEEVPPQGEDLCGPHQGD